MAATQRRPPLLLIASLALLVGVAVSRAAEDPPSPASGAEPTSRGATSAVTPSPTGDPGSTARPDDELQVRVPASGGDGDSWRDTEGREYRLGLVNAPEAHECFGGEATAARRQLTADGFAADVYAVDHYGRGVAVVRTADGRDLNVHLARHGFADDRYLAQFRDENPQLAARLDLAFATARTERRGLWGACSDVSRLQVPAGTAVPERLAPSTGSSDACHRDYTTCIGVRGDGSGSGAPNDLDCGSVDAAVQLRQKGVDPYRLDADGDGVGCDS